jgi:signal transduction histidine kinase
MLPRGLPYRLPLLGGLGAVVVAAALVAYLQHQSSALERQRTLVIVRQVCERSASAIVDRLQDVFGDAVIDSIEGIGHPQLKAYNLARVDEYFSAGQRQSPYVSRFFLWHERMPPAWRDQMLFYRPPGESGRLDVEIPGASPPRGGFFSDRLRGEALWSAAQRFAALGRSFAVEEVVFDGARHQAVFHILWSDPRRLRTYCVVGFLVNLERFREHGIERLATQSLASVLNPNGDAVPLALRVEDERGRRVYGAPTPPREPFASETFDLLFFPRKGMEPYVANMPSVARWKVTVSPVGPPPATTHSGFWLLAAVVLLLLVAVVCAVSVNRQAIRLSELQSDFVANVSHQLRTPLAMLSGAAETLGLERVRSPEKVKEYADMIQAQARRLSVLVDQILHFHRAELAGHESARRPVDLGELVARAAEQFHALAERTAVTIHVEHASPAPIVRGDPLALEYAVVSLLENAVKYGNGRSNKVTVSACARGGFGVITVRDRGIGIDQGDIPHIFDKFYRGRSNGQVRSGFGLGLAIVRSTVLVHGGRIAVDSEPGRGSEFTVWLPLLA